MDDSDLWVRLGAFAFLDERRRQSSDLFDRRELQRGFMFEGERVPLQDPQRIFKPRVCSFHLRITTVSVKDDGTRTSDDAIGNDGLLRYRYRGRTANDVNHRDNLGLREGDTLVVHTEGFRDNLWLDVIGSPMSDAAKMTERMRRRNYGTLEIDLTIDDPKTYTRPFTVKLVQLIELDTELVDEFCLENEKSYQLMLRGRGK